MNRKSSRHTALKRAAVGERAAGKHLRMGLQGSGRKCPVVFRVKE